MLNNKINVLIIGFGQIGAQNSQDKLTKKSYRFSNHLQAINASKKYQLVGIVDNNSKIREIAKNKYKIKNVFSSIFEAKQNIKKIDLAVISTPPIERYELISSLYNIKGLIIEKPVSLNINESKKILRFCQKKKIICEVNYWRRFVPQFLENNKIFELLGNLQSSIIYYSGGLKNNGVHLIDLMRFKYGEITNLSVINSFKSSEKETINGDFNIPFSGKIRNTPLIGLPIQKKFYRENSLELTGSKGKLLFQNDGRKLFFNKIRPHGALTKNLELNYDRPVNLKIDFDLAIKKLYQSFYSTLQNNKKLVSPLSNAIKNEELISNLKFS